MTVQPFEIRIEPAVLDDLRDRLRRTRWPDEIDGAGWDYGMTGSVLRSFVQTWLEEFDWPTQQFGSTSTRIFGSTSTGSACTPPSSLEPAEEANYRQSPDADRPGENPPRGSTDEGARSGRRG